MLNVCAVLVSLRKDDTRLAGSKLKTETSIVKDSGRWRFVCVEAVV